MQADEALRLPCVATSFRKTNRALTRAYEAALGAHGMSLAQFSLLSTLARHGELPLSRLAEREVMDRSTLSRALGPLERAGWVSVRDLTARSRQVMLTPQGKQALVAARRAWGEVQRALVARIGTDNWRKLAPWLPEIADYAIDGTG